MAQLSVDAHVSLVLGTAERMLDEVAAQLWLFAGLGAATLLAALLNLVGPAEC